MNKLLCIGHRGAMGHAPENTLASFDKALELGASCLELDVYQVDNQLLVFHDDSLERTTNGQGMLLDHSWTYLRSLDAGQGERIPTLAEVCTLINATAGLSIELKGPGTAEPVIQFVHSLLTDRWSRDLILISSFDRHQLQTCRALDDQVKLGVLFNDLAADHLEFACSLGAYAVHPSLEIVDEPMVRSAQANGLRVFVYTVNRPSDILRMAKIGVDGVFTNYPERVIPDHFSGDQKIGWP